MLKMNNNNNDDDDDDIIYRLDQQVYLTIFFRVCLHDDEKVNRCFYCVIVLVSCLI